MRVRCDLRRHGLVTLQTGSIAIHLWFQLRVMRPVLQARLVRRIEMHFVTGDAREFAAAKTGGSLRAVKFAAGDSNHSIAPETVLKKIRFGFANEIFLLGMIGGVRLHDELLCEVIFARTKSAAMSVEIDLVCHVVESPDAVALATRERRFGALQFRRIRHARIGFIREMNLKAANGIAIESDMFAAFAVTCFASDAEFRHLRIPFVALDETRFSVGNMTIHARTVPRADGINFL